MLEIVNVSKMLNGVYIAFIIVESIVVNIGDNCCQLLCAMLQRVYLFHYDHQLI